MTGSRSRALICVAGLALLVSACGTRVPHSEVVAAASGGGGGGPQSAALGGSQPSGSAGSSTGSGTYAGGDTGGSPSATGPAAGVTAGSGGGAAASNPAGGQGSSTGGAGGASSGATGSPGAAAGGGGGGGGGAQASGTPIAVGNVGTYSGVVGSSLSAAQPMAKVWARWVNQHGGIDGHPVVLYTADDGGDPNKAVSLSEQMVQQDHVVAFIGDMVPLTIGAIATYVDQAHVPLLGGDASAPDWNQHPMVFPQGTGALALYDKSAGFDARFIQEAGGNNWGALYCAEDAACSTAYQHASAAAKAAGLNPVYSAQVSLSQPSYTAQCLQAAAAKVKILVVTLDANSVERVARDCSAQNFNPLYASGSVIVTSALAQDPQLENMISIEPTFPWTDAATPAEAEYQQAIQAIDPGLAVSSATSAEWTAGKLLEAALAGVSPSEKITPETVVSGLYKLHNDTLGGLAPPLTFLPGKPAPLASCYFGVQIKNGRWVGLNNGQAYC